MIRWLTILTDPPQHVHDARARPYLPAGELAHEILAAVGTLRASADGEIPGMTLDLDNTEGQSVPLMRRPPLGAEAVLYGHRGDSTVELFRGVVTSCSCGQAAAIEVSA